MWVPGFNFVTLTVLKKTRKKFFFINGKIVKYIKEVTLRGYGPDSGLHDTSAHCPRVYQVSILQLSEFLRNL